MFGKTIYFALLTLQQSGGNHWTLGPLYVLRQYKTEKYATVDLVPIYWFLKNFFFEIYVLKEPNCDRTGRVHLWSVLWALGCLSCDTCPCIYLSVLHSEGLKKMIVKIGQFCQLWKIYFLLVCRLNLLPEYLFWLFNIWQRCHVLQTYKTHRKYMIIRHTVNTW